MNTDSKTNYRALIRSGQYYIGPTIPDLLSEDYNWKNYKLNGSLYIAAHPNTNVEHIYENGVTLALVGFIIDPEHPQRNDHEVLENILSRTDLYADPLGVTERLGGRWVMVIGRQDNTYIFSDPAGLRQIYYSFANDSLHCSAEPGLLARICESDIDEDAERFSNSGLFKAKQEFWWPGDSTPFKEIKCLLPNFYLSERDKLVRRYWPIKNFEPQDAKDVVPLVSERLRGMVDAIFLRGPIAVSSTAGIDSRIMLAASYTHAEILELMTAKQRGMPETHPDLQIPHMFSEKFNLRHTIVDGNNNIRDDFRRAYQESVYSFHEKWLPDAQSIFDQYRQETISVVGSLVEVTRLFYNNALPAGKNISSKDLAKAAGLDEHPFATREFQLWLDSINDVFNYNIADIFYWEQRAGRWLASAQLEFSLAWKDIFTPFNSREMIVSLLAIDPKLRIEPGSIVFMLIIGNLWPDLLSEPINPHKSNARATLIRRAARRLKRY
jgi:hypothetical protein